MFWATLYFAFNMTPFCIYFGFVTPSFNSFSKSFFFFVTVFFGWLFDYVSRSLWSHLPPAHVYAMVAEGDHPNEVPLKELMNCTGLSVEDLRIPGPERAFDFEPASESDRASLAQSALDTGAGDVWRRHFLDRISEQHAERDIFVAWAARRLSLQIAENPEQTIDGAFGAVMTDGANRGSRVLGPLSAQYAPQSEAARELSDARFCTANGLLLLSVELIKSSVSASAPERAIQLKFGGARYAVEFLVASLKLWMLAMWFSTSTAPSKLTSACCALTQSSTSSLRASSQASLSERTVARNCRRVFDSKPQLRSTSSGRRKVPCPSQWQSCEQTSVTC